MVEIGSVGAYSSSPTYGSGTRDTDDSYDGLSEDDKIVHKARDDFRRCKTWESHAANNFRQDIKFANGDSYNNWQWNDRLVEGRKKGNRPSLTCNKVRQHCLQITNDARQNKPSITLRPTGEGSSYESAKIFEGIVRHIEYISNAQQAYDHATRTQVQGGVGYWRVITDYVDETSMDQEIYIRRIKDCLNVYLDPDISEADGSDARFAIIFDDVNRKVFEKKYPKWKNDLAETALDDEGWYSEDKIRIAEYYRTKETTSTMVFIEGRAIKESDLPKQLRDIIPPETQRREVTEKKIEWFKIAGDKIVERSEWPGKYIPIVRLIGEEFIIDGKLDRRGHTRALIDPQRMYNYWTSQAAESVALQSKVPYIGSVEAIEEHQDLWETANTENHPILPYREWDEQGRKLTAPTRQEPPQMAQAYIQGMAHAQNEMMLVSGQYQADFGAPSNERSGKAINERQRQGDNATYHFIDHLGIAIRYTGVILIDLIPKIYDTQRIIRIMSEAGDQSHVVVDPNAQQALAQQQNTLTGEVKQIFNPSVGKYDVEADIGPAYATKRQEAFNALSQIIAQNSDLVHIAGDLMFRAADFPMADELAERFKRMLPPQATGQGPSPAEQQMQQHIQQLTGMLQASQKELTETQLRESRLKADRDIAARHQMSEAQRQDYDSETKRLAAVGGIDPEALKPVVRELVSQILGAAALPIMAAHAKEDNKRLPPEPAAANGSGS